MSNLCPLEQGLFEAIDGDDAEAASCSSARGAGMNMFTTRGKCPFFYALMKVRDSEII